jgi:flagellar hook assembly protein FlgD
MIETPADDWGVDMTTRGEMTIGMASGVADKDAGVVNGFALGNNYPNPFNPETVISYSVPASGEVSLSIFNTLGQKVRTLVDGGTAAGTYKATWDGRNDYGQLMSSGIYYYTLKSANTAITKRMVFLK